MSYLVSKRSSESLSFKPLEDYIFARRAAAVHVFRDDLSLTLPPHKPLRAGVMCDAARASLEDGVHTTYIEFFVAIFRLRRHSYRVDNRNIIVHKPVLLNTMV